MLRDLDTSKFKAVYIVTGYTDLRNGIDGLAGIIQHQYYLDPFDADGFLLLYKRLEDGRFQWPRNATEVINMSPQQYKWLMEGLSIHQKRYVKEVYAKQIV